VNEMNRNCSYCTYFNKDYLDKGLAMLRSLREHNANARLYVLALDDDITYPVLAEKAPAGTSLIRLGEIETAYPGLSAIKTGRSAAEYFWTLTPHLIEFILDTKDEEFCTYLDADLWFFGDPDILNAELEATGRHTLIVGHRFPDTEEGRRLARANGTFCVQFNTFTNHPESRRLLSWWKDRVVENCEYNKRKGSGGDQKYLEQFPGMSEGVGILENEGGGVAPWNLSRYQSTQTTRPRADAASALMLRNRETGAEFPLVFYHYQNLKYLGRRLANIRVGRADPRLKKTIYLPYLREVERVRTELEQSYNLRFSGSRSVSRNPLIAFAQLYLARARLKDWAASDIIRF